ncbi:MAG TPA: hypothetical protein VFL41_06825 [Gaiellaceae bacterium]|nr:hypothetical protein [Gaiellaceae bacterium]HET8652985.1 hypothetical protein [Gaiellaceae bacterium]
MARNKRQTFGKLQRERERAEKRERKQEKKEAKKAAAEAGLVLDPETGQYVDPSELQPGAHVAPADFPD